MENAPNETERSYRIFMEAIFAVEEEDPAQLNMLLENYPYIVQMQDDYGKILLHKVFDSFTLNVEMVLMLMRAESSVSELNYNNETPLHLALNRNSFEVQNLLLHRADLALRAFWTKPLLQAAVQSENVFVPIVKKMIHKGLRGQINYRGRLRNPTLHLALSNPQVTPELVQLLLLEGADVNMIGFNGLSPLHCALSNTNCQYAVVEMLLKAGANVQAQERKYKPPICTAVVNYNMTEEIIILLIQHGALPKQYVEARGVLDTVFFTPVHYYEGYRNINIIIKHLALTVPDFSTFGLHESYNGIFNLVRVTKTVRLFSMSLYEYIQNGYIPRKKSEDELSVEDKRDMDALLPILSSKRFDLFRDIIEHNIRRKELAYKISSLCPCVIKTPSKEIDISPIVVVLADYIMQKTDLLNFCLAFYSGKNHETSFNFSDIKRKRRKWVPKFGDFV